MSSPIPSDRELQRLISSATTIGVVAVKSQSEASRTSVEGTSETLDALTAAYPIYRKLRQLNSKRIKSFFADKRYLAYEKGKNPKQKAIPLPSKSIEDPANPLIKLIMPGASPGFLNKCASALSAASTANDGEPLPVDKFRDWLAGPHKIEGTDRVERGLTGAYNAAVQARKLKNGTKNEGGEPEAPAETSVDWDAALGPFRKSAEAVRISDLPVQLPSETVPSILLVLPDGDPTVCSIAILPVTEQRLRELIAEMATGLEEIV